MKKRLRYVSLLPVYAVVLTAFLLVAVVGSKTVNILRVNAPVLDRTTFIIDAGHGGVDGGATSCTGVLESKFNLEIALKLNDLMHLLGMNTQMIRQTDCSVYTQGETISQKKISDLKERVRLVNATPNAVLLSIHQNHFSEEKYSGAQVFFAPTNSSKTLAKAMQSNFLQSINPNSHRQVKKADGVYLMQKVNCPAVLIECGFLSNPQEEYLLRSTEYQQKICAVIATTCSNYLNHSMT